MPETKERMSYGESLCGSLACHALLMVMGSVQLGSSGLKVSRFVLGTMQYGSKEWQSWIIEEDVAIAHIKAA